MKVLILHQHFKTPQTGGAIRSYYLARVLADHGMKVAVITAHDDRPVNRNTEGIDVHYLQVPYHNRFGFYRRSRSFLRFAIQCTKAARQIGPFDLCYAISTPLTVGWAAWRIKRNTGMPYLFEVGDLWPDAPIEMGYIRNPILKWLLFRLERFIYRNALAVVSLSEAIQFAVKKKAPGKTVHLIPNMADCDFYRPAQKNPMLLNRFGVNEKLVVSYIGAMGVANGLDYMVGCALECSKSNLPIHFLLCGDGARRTPLEKKVRELKLDNLTILPFCNREGVREIMNVTDAVFVCYQNVAILETGSPGKYFDGLAAGKLIIINFGGWIKKEIEEQQCGFHSHPERPLDFARNISPFVNKRELLYQYQRSARSLAEKKYSLVKLGEEFAGIVKASLSPALRP